MMTVFFFFFFFLLQFPPNVTMINCSFPMSVSLTLNNIIEVVRNKQLYFSNALCSFEISAVASINELEGINECRKMYIKIISVIQCRNPAGSIALRLSADALSYRI